MSALSVNSSFYYGWRITTQNRFIDFNDGSDKVATLKTGAYTSLELAVEVKKQMEAVSLLDFTVTFNRTTRRFVIASTTNFTLKFSSGVNFGLSAREVLGFDAVDLTSFSSYTAQNASGFAYNTQFYLQSYKPTTLNRKAIDGVVNKSASGATEVIKFGNDRFMECDFKFITDVIQSPGSIVRNSQTGVADFLSFIEWCTEKFPIEFMENESLPNEYQSFILESTPQDSKGLDFELVETYDRGLPFYYESGRLKFRLI